MKRISLLAVAAGMAIFAVPPSVPAAETFQDETTVLVVEVPVRVLRHGRPVEGLRAENFRVFDRGEPRELVGFDIIDRGRPASRQPKTRGGAFQERARQARTYLILFDFAYSGSGGLARALDASRWLLGEEIQPRDRVAVAFYSALRGLKLLTGFSADRERISTALDVIAAMLARDRKAAGALYDRLLPHPQAAPDAPLALREEVVAEAGILVRADPFWPHRSVVRSFARGLATLPDWQSDLPGDKSVLYLSQGFSPGLLTGKGSAGTVRQIEEVFRSLRRGGWAIHGINVGGSRASGGRDTLFYLAHETGGESLENFNDMQEAFARMLHRTSVTYLLAFQATGVEANGHFRRLKVKLEGVPEGGRVIHRPGYYAPPPPGSSEAP